jgi:hypothetical protein
MTLNNETPVRFALTTDVEIINRRINFLLNITINIISVRGEVWAHKINLSPAFFLKGLYQARKVSGSCIYVLGVSILPFL